MGRGGGEERENMICHVTSHVAKVHQSNNTTYHFHIVSVIHLSWCLISYPSVSEQLLLPDAATSMQTT